MRLHPHILFDGIHMVVIDGDIHEVARNRGLKREWYQDGKFPHYDVFGAPARKLRVNCTTRELVRIMRGPYDTRIALRCPRCGGRGFDTTVMYQPIGARHPVMDKCILCDNHGVIPGPAFNPDKHELLFTSKYCTIAYIHKPMTELEHYVLGAVHHGEIAW